MAPHRRRKQKQRSTTSPYKIPEWRAVPSTVRHELLEQDTITAYLQQSMRICIQKRVIQLMNKTKAEQRLEKFQELKEELYNSKRVPRGMLVTAEELAGCNTGIIAKSLIHFKLRPVEMWIRHVEEHFDDVVSSATDVPTRNDDDDDEDRINRANVTKLASTRSVIVPLATVMRPDLPQTTLDHVLQTLDQAVTTASDHYADLSALIMCTALSTKDFRSRYDADGNVLKELIPTALYDPNFKDCTKRFDESNLDEKSRLDFENLFSKQHIRWIHRANFGKRGTQKSSKDSHPIWDKLQEHMVSTTGSSFRSHDTPLSILDHVNNAFTINFFNMWSQKKLCNKSFASAVELLLKLNLRPNAAIKDRDKPVQSKNDDADDMKIGRNRKRSLLRKELKKMSTCKNKAASDISHAEKWSGKAQAAERRFNYFRTIEIQKKKAEEADESENDNRDKANNEDESEDPDVDEVKISQDVSCRRLKRITGIFKTMLWKTDKSEITEEVIQGYDYDFTEHEKALLIRIYKPLKSCLPKTWTIFQQIQLVNFCNDILRASKHYKDLTNIVPLPSSASLHTLKVDAATIYDLFSGRKRGYDIFKEDGTKIYHVRDAISHKDACFAAFFDVNQINSVCTSHGLCFQHVIMVRPGIKTVCLLGDLRSIDAARRRSAYTRSGEDTSTKSTSITKSEKTLKEAELLEVNNEIKSLNAELSKLVINQRKNCVKQNSLIKAIKQEWRKKDVEDRHNKQVGLERWKVSDKEKLHEQICMAKANRRTSITAIMQTRAQLKHCRQKAYCLRKAISLPTTKNKRKLKSDASVQLPSCPTLTTPSYIDIPSRIRLEDLKASGASLMFSGTDYGLRTMSVTVPMEEERYKFHLNLFQQGATTDELLVDRQYLQFPKAFFVHSSTVNELCLQKRFQKVRERRKKCTAEGEEVQRLEKGLYAAANYQSAKDYYEYFKVQVQARKTLRAFYWSPKRVNEKRTAELWDSNIKDKIASTEREFVSAAASDTKKVLPILCIGNQGTCVGSPIKGYARRGGKWLLRRHGRYTTVAWTNEHRTSQTCVFCFEQVIRPTSDKGKVCNGTSLCINPQCLAFKQGRAAQGRDKEAAMAIALAGMSYAKWESHCSVQSSYGFLVFFD